MAVYSKMADIEHKKAENKKSCKKSHSLIELQPSAL